MESEVKILIPHEKWGPSIWLESSEMSWNSWSVGRYSDQVIIEQ